MTDTPTLRGLLDDRGLTREQAAVLGGVHPSTIGRIVSGDVHASPATVVSLARALGVGARRMQRMCDAHYLSAHPDEDLAGGDGDATAA
jgi:plasmid maintenance system antidote protein VapI